MNAKLFSRIGTLHIHPFLKTGTVTTAINIQPHATLTQVDRRSRQDDEVEQV